MDRDDHLHEAVTELLFVDDGGDEMVRNESIIDKQFYDSIVHKTC